MEEFALWISDGDAVICTHSKVTGKGRATQLDLDFKSQVRHKCNWMGKDAGAQLSLALSRGRIAVVKRYCFCCFTDGLSHEDVFGEQCVSYAVDRYPRGNCPQ